jgi:TrmH family RNA methyltransferase
MITSTSNPRVKWVRALQAKRRAREEEGLFVVEGLRLAGEVVSTQQPVRLVLHTDTLDARGRGLVNQLARLGAAVEAVTPAVMAACSDTQSPPGILAVVPIPKLAVSAKPQLVLVADGLADPGNLGTLLRTAAAAGVEVVLLTEGTVDAFNPKAVRGAMGAHLRLPIQTMADETLVRQLTGVEVWVAQATQGLPYDQVDWSPPAAVVIGSEAEGPRIDWRSVGAQPVHIAMAGETESLNAAVAAAVILFEIVRQRGRVWKSGH